MYIYMKWEKINIYMKLERRTDWSGSEVTIFSTHFYAIHWGPGVKTNQCSKLCLPPIFLRYFCCHLFKKALAHHKLKRLILLQKMSYFIVFTSMVELFYVLFACVNTFSLIMTGSICPFQRISALCLHVIPEMAHRNSNLDFLIQLIVLYIFLKL